MPSEIEYVITDASATPYQHPAFTSEPAFCPFEYHYSDTKLVNAEGNEATAISRSQDTFSFFYNSDLAPVTGNQKQTVTITAKSYSIYG
jgi:hypothetical protein